jgi:hypothetical protein
MGCLFLSWAYLCFVKRPLRHLLCAAHLFHSRVVKVMVSFTSQVWNPCFSHASSVNLLLSGCLQMALLAAGRLSDARQEQGYPPLTESSSLPVLKAVLLAAQDGSLCCHAAVTALSGPRGVTAVGEASSGLSQRLKVPLCTGCSEPAYPPSDLWDTYSMFLEEGDEAGNFNSWFCLRYCQGDLLLGCVKYEDPSLWTCILCAQQAISDGAKPVSVHLTSASDELARRLPDIAGFSGRTCQCGDQGLVAPEVGSLLPATYHARGGLIYDTFLEDRLPPGQLTSSLCDSIVMEAVDGGMIKVSRDDVLGTEAEVALAEARAVHAGYTLDSVVRGVRLYVGRSPKGVSRQAMKRKRTVNEEASSSHEA